MDIDKVMIRPPGPGDGAGLAETQLDASAHLAELAPALFGAVPGEGRAERLERISLDATNPDVLWRVAESDGRVVGYVFAELRRPDPTAQGVRYVGQLRLWINSLAVQTAYHRRGIATRLMAAAEKWGRAHGAELVMLQTWADSPESVPFYEKIGYRRRALIFQREL